MDGTTPTAVPQRVVHPLRPGDPAVLGRYELLARLPSGGMGADVYTATAGGETFVVKALAAGSGAPAVERFCSEVANAERISSQRVAGVIDADLTAERPHYVQRYVEGTPLDELIADRPGGLRAEELRRLAIGLLLALADIHAVQVAHRDIKPGNIIITGDGDVVVVDFGISRTTDELGAFDMTRAVVSVVTPRFAAPEQMVQGDTLTRAVDVYAWGMVVAYAATGRYPVDGNEQMDIADYLRSLEREAFELSALPPAVSVPVREALRYRADRRPSVQQLLREVESATRWDPPPADPTAVLVSQPRWRLADLRSVEAVRTWLRYSLSALERAVVDDKLTYAALIGAAVLLGALAGLVLAVLWYVVV